MFENRIVTVWSAPNYCYMCVFVLAISTLLVSLQGGVLHPVYSELWFTLSSLFVHSSFRRVSSFPSGLQRSVSTSPQVGYQTSPISRNSHPFVRLAHSFYFTSVDFFTSKPPVSYTLRTMFPFTNGTILDTVIRCLVV